MTLGTIVKGFNTVYFGRWVELVFEVFTQIALLMCLFGFMDLLIIVKWLTNWDKYEAEHTTEIAPGIIQTMIVMFIKTGVRDPAKPGQCPLASEYSTCDQATVIPDQTATMQSLLLVALATVPLMLLVRPVWEAFKSSRAEAHQDDFARVDDDGQPGANMAHKE